MKTNKFLILLLIFISLCFAGCNKKQYEGEVIQDYVIKINNNEIKQGEVYTYFYEVYKNFESIGGEDIWDTDFDGRTAQEVAKESVLNTLTVVNVCKEKAKELNITLTDDEKNEAKSEAEIFYNEIDDKIKSETDIKLEDVINVMEDKVLYSKVYDYFTKGYVVSEADFDTYWLNAKVSYADYYTELSIRSIAVNNVEDAQEAFTRIKSGVDFSEAYDLFNNSEINPDGKDEKVIYKGDLEYELSADLDIVKGDLSEPIEYKNGYYLIMIDDVKENDESSIRNICKKDYELTMKNKIFVQEYSKWEEMAQIKTNDQLWNNINIDTIVKAY